MVQKNPDLSKLLKTTLDELKNLENGEIFKVRDLFKGYEWNRFPKGTRLTLGSMFFAHMSANTEKQCLGVEILEKTTSNQQQYRKL